MYRADPNAANSFSFHTFLSWAGIAIIRVAKNEVANRAKTDLKPLPLVLPVSLISHIILKKMVETSTVPNMGTYFFTEGGDTMTVPVERKVTSSGQGSVMAVMDRVRVRVMVACECDSKDMMYEHTIIMLELSPHCNEVMHKITCEYEVRLEALKISNLLKIEDLTRLPTSVYILALFLIQSRF